MKPVSASRLLGALLLGVLLGLLVACDPFAPGAEENLTARTEAGAMTSPNCAACHGNPPHDIMHTFHLTSYVVNRDNIANPTLNGPITCMDCHFSSVRHYQYVYAESVWVDTNGGELSGPLSPSDSLIVTLYPQFRPVPYPGVDSSHAEAAAKAVDSLILKEAMAGRVVQWMTGLAHLDGKRGVEYPPNNVYGGALLDTAYHPNDLSCSAVACHNRAFLRYRFASPARGISVCPSLTKHDTTCGEPAP